MRSSTPFSFPFQKLTNTDLLPSKIKEEIKPQTIDTIFGELNKDMIEEIKNIIKKQNTKLFYSRKIQL